MQFCMSMLPYDFARDLAAISQVSSLTYVMYDLPSFPVKSVADLVAYAKANPGKVNYASGGSIQYLGWGLLSHQTGIKLVQVPCKGGSAVVTAVLSGRRAADERGRVRACGLQPGAVQRLYQSPGRPVECPGERCTAGAELGPCRRRQDAYGDVPTMAEVIPGESFAEMQPGCQASSSTTVVDKPGSGSNISFTYGATHA